ncbi:MAG: preprotein translocase subunit SecE [Acidobacteria bacterium]|nr:preprotein translocase subunit SecE [Acidobacteriota bacterium]
MSDEQKGTSSKPAWLEGLLAYPQRFRQFLHEVRQEMNRVTWPTWNDVKATTVVVIVTVFFFGVFLALVDQGVLRAVEWVLQFKP